MKLHLCLFNTAGFSIASFGKAAFITASFLCATIANAQVYKCIFIDGVTRQNKVVYTDAPCGKAERQTLTAIQAKSQLTTETPQASQTTQLAQANALDSAVTRAVLSRDFKLAESLATTKEHWRLIAIAEGEAAPQPLIVANSRPEISRADECAQAKDNFESVSRTSWRDKDLVAAKKSVMYVACGVPEPVQNRPILIGHTYGGFGGYGNLYNGHRYQPSHAVPHQAGSHEGVGHHTYPVIQHFHDRNQAGSSASLSYKSKHFGFSVNSAH